MPSAMISRPRRTRTFGVAPNLALAHHAAGDLARLGNLEDLAHFRHADDAILIDGLKHPFERLLDVLKQRVDHVIQADFNGVGLSQFYERLYRR